MAAMDGFFQCPNCLLFFSVGWVRGHACFMRSYLWDVSFTCLQISLERKDSDEGPMKAMLDTPKIPRFKNSPDSSLGVV